MKIKKSKLKKIIESSIKDIRSQWKKEYEEIAAAQAASEYKGGVSSFEEDPNFDKHWSGGLPGSRKRLGNYVWPELHSDIGLEIEKDTPIESLLIQQIEGLFKARKNGNYYRMDPYYVQKIKNIVDEFGYTNIFRAASPDTNQYLYRGIVMERVDFEKVFGVIPNDSGTFFQRSLRSVQNTFNRFLLNISGLEKYNKTATTWDQIKPNSENKIYSDGAYRNRIQSGRSVKDTQQTISYSFWTSSLTSAFNYAKASRNMLSFRDPVIFVITSSTNTSTFLSLDPLISQYDFIKRHSIGTPKGEFILIGDAQINSIYIFYDKGLGSRTSDEESKKKEIASVKRNKDEDNNPQAIPR